jgi:hypothetical protein
MLYEFIFVSRLNDNTFSGLPLSKYDGRIWRNDVRLRRWRYRLRRLHSSSHLFGPNFLLSPFNNIGYQCDRPILA